MLAVDRYTDRPRLNRFQRIFQDFAKCKFAEFVENFTLLN